MFIEKSKYWWGVLYEENMQEDWEVQIGDILHGLPYCYCKHTPDTDSQSEYRKDHIHLIIAFSNTTTYNHAFKLFSGLNAPGKVACNKIESCISIRHSFDYLIHDTEGCREKGKYQYPAASRVTGNHFDIDLFAPLSKKYILRELQTLIVSEHITNFDDFVKLVEEKYGDNHDYFVVLLSSSGYLKKIIRLLGKVYK